jgi:hypothetical protein
MKIHLLKALELRASSEIHERNFIAVNDKKNKVLENCLKVIFMRKKFSSSHMRKFQRKTHLKDAFEKQKTLSASS